MDLAHVFEGREGPVADSIFLQNEAMGWPDRLKWLGFWRGVRTQRWKYARWRNEDGHTVLFDLENDPHELKNLAGKAEYTEIQAKMEALTQDWIKKTNDPFETGKRFDPVTKMLYIGQEFASDRWTRFERWK